MGWPEHLDAMEEALRAASATVHDGAPPRQVALPPVDGPLPAELAPRARALLDATRQLEAEARQRMAEVGHAATRLRARRLSFPGTGREVPAYVDTRV